MVYWYNRLVKKYIAWFLTFAWAVLIWRLTTTPDFSVTEDTFLSFLISNGGHFIFFGILAVLLIFSLPKRLCSLHFTIFTVSLYGLFIELVQRNIHGRSADPIDLALDTLGAITFLAIINRSKLKHYL